MSIAGKKNYNSKNKRKTWGRERAGGCEPNQELKVLYNLKKNSWRGCEGNEGIVQLRTVGSSGGVEPKLKVWFYTIKKRTKNARWGGWGVE